MSNELKSKIMSITYAPDPDWTDDEQKCYIIGHRDARKAACEIVCAAPSVASGAQNDTTPLPDDFWELVSNCGGSKDLGKNARLLQEWVKNYALSTIAAQAKPVEMNEDQIDAIWEGLDGKAIIQGESQMNWNRELRRAFAKAILANSAPNKALVEALRNILVTWPNQPKEPHWTGRWAKALDDGRAALNAAGVEVK